MSDLRDDLRRAQLERDQLEPQKQDLAHQLRTLNDAIKRRRDLVWLDNYSEVCLDRELIPILEAVHRSLEVLAHTVAGIDSRLARLEARDPQDPQD